MSVKRKQTKVLTGSDGHKHVDTSMWMRCVWAQLVLQMSGKNKKKQKKKKKLTRKRGWWTWAGVQMRMVDGCGWCGCG